MYVDLPVLSSAGHLPGHVGQDREQEEGAIYQELHGGSGVRSLLVFLDSRFVCVLLNFSGRCCQHGSQWSRERAVRVHNCSFLTTSETKSALEEVCSLDVSLNRYSFTFKSDIILEITLLFWHLHQQTIIKLELSVWGKSTKGIFSVKYKHLFGGDF